MKKPSRGRFISFEGTEGSGKSTQIKLLAERLGSLGYQVRLVREPGGTPLGEEIRHTLKHSPAGAAMARETELLLMCASRAQLVREVIRPALAAGEVVLCDRFHDSTTAYQGYGRQLPLDQVRTLLDFAIGATVPDLTLLLQVPLAVSEARRQSRQTMLFNVPQKTAADNAARPLPFDRFEEADRAFFLRVENGFHAIAAADPARIKTIDATQTVAAVAAQVWQQTESALTGI